MQKVAPNMLVFTSKSPTQNTNMDIFVAGGASKLHLLYAHRKMMARLTRQRTQSLRYLGHEKWRFFQKPQNID
jgi:hypothetical protein